MDSPPIGLGNDGPMTASRLLLINIIATCAFYVASFAVLGSAFPSVESSGEDIVRWFSAHGTRAKAYAWCSAFVSLGLAIFAGQVSTLMPKPHRYIFLAGVLGFAITTQVQAWLWAGLAYRPENLDPATAHTFFAISAFWGPLVNGSTTAMAAAFVALGFARTPIIPNWLKWLSVIFFIEQAVETITVFGQTGFLAPGGAMNVYLGGALGFLWVAGVVRWAMHRMDQPARARD